MIHYYSKLLSNWKGHSCCSSYMILNLMSNTRPEHLIGKERFQDSDRSTDEWHFTIPQSGLCISLAC